MESLEGILNLEAQTSEALTVTALLAETSFSHRALEPQHHSYRFQVWGLGFRVTGLGLGV